MNEGVNAFFLQIALKGIAMRSEDRKDVIDICACLHQAGHVYRLMLNMGIIGMCNSLPSVIIFIQITEFHIEHSCLHFIQTAVSSLVGSYIFFLKTIVGDGTDDLCQLFIISGHRSSITQSTEVLARIKAVTSNIAQRTGLWKS